MFKVYTIEQNEEWDTIVRLFKEYDVYYLSGYVKSFQIHGDGEPYLFYYERTENDLWLRGMNVVMKRDISNCDYFKDKIEQNRWFDFITPYGYGGWIIEGNGNKKELFRLYDKWCNNHNIISEFVRYHPVLENYRYSQGYYDIQRLGETITLDLSSPEIIWSNLISKNRNMVRKAIKSGVAIYNGRFPEIFNKFQEIYNQTMDKDQADEYYYFKSEFYNTIMNDLAEQSQVFYATLGEKIIAASIILTSNGKLNYHLSGSLKEYQNLAPSNLLLYKAALWGYANGCTTFHLGGGVGSQHDNLYKFKSSFFKGNPCDFYIGKKIFNEEIYNQLCDEKKVGKDSTFFPRYRI